MQFVAWLCYYALDCTASSITSQLSLASGFWLKKCRQPGFRLQDRTGYKPILMFVLEII